MRKLFDNESPLGLLLRWTLDQHQAVGGGAGDKSAAKGHIDLHREHFNRTLSVKRLVLQENETGDIEVRFSLGYTIFIYMCTDNDSHGCTQPAAQAKLVRFESAGASYPHV